MSNTVQPEETQIGLTQVFRLGKDTLFYGGTSAAGKVVSLALVPLYTRFFSPSEYGVIELLLTASALLSRILSFGVDSALLRFYGDSPSQDRKRKLSSAALWYMLAAGVPVCVISSLFARQISSSLFNSNVHSALVALMLLTVPFVMLGWIPQDLTRLRFDKLRYNFLIVGGSIFYGIAAVVLVVLLHKGLWGVMMGHFLRAGLFGILGIILVRHSLSLRIDFSAVKKLLVFGAPLLPASIALWVSSSSDRFFLARFASLHSVGVYSIANRLAWVQWFVFSSFQLAFTPIAYSIYKRPGAATVFRKVFIYYIILSSILGIGISVFGLNILQILTPQAYHPAHVAVGLLNLSVIFHGLFYIFGIGISIAKRTKYFAYSYVAGAIANIVLNVLLIPPFRVIGAASATSISFAITAILGSHWSRKSYPLHLPLRKAILICALFLIFNALGILIDSFLGGHIPAKLLTFFAFMTCILLLLDREDKVLLVRLLKKLAKIGRRGL
jgi:O-antigen/teichoic acid export membrane protein